MLKLPTPYDGLNNTLNACYFCSRTIRYAAGIIVTIKQTFDQCFIARLTTLFVQVFVATIHIILSNILFSFLSIKDSIRSYLRTVIDLWSNVKKQQSLKQNEFHLTLFLYSATFSIFLSIHYRTCDYFSSGNSLFNIDKIKKPTIFNSQNLFSIRKAPNCLLLL